MSVAPRPIALAAAVITVACSGGNTQPGNTQSQGGAAAPGADRTAKTAALETGANLLQAKAPVEKIAVYLNGFHVSKPTRRCRRKHTTGV